MMFIFTDDLTTAEESSEATDVPGLQASGNDSKFVVIRVIQLFAHYSYVVSMLLHDTAFKLDVAMTPCTSRNNRHTIYS